MKYRRKAIEVEVMRWDGENTDAVILFSGGQVEVFHSRFPSAERLLLVHQRNGISFLEIGNLIVVDGEGFVRAMTPEALEEEYEEVGGEGEEVGDRRSEVGFADTGRAAETRRGEGGETS